MDKKYIVRLNDAEREQLNLIVKKFSGSSQKVRRAQILMKSDANGPAWTDKQIADAFGCRTKTVENIRQRLVESGFSQTLEGKMRSEPARPKCLTGDEEARIIATRLGKPPAGYANWTLRLLADKVVELQISPKVSHETIRQTLKKTG
jgi:transposase